MGHHSIFLFFWLFNSIDSINKFSWWLDSKSRPLGWMQPPYQFSHKHCPTGFIIHIELWLKFMAGSVIAKKFDSISPCCCASRWRRSSGSCVAAAAAAGRWTASQARPPRFSAHHHHHHHRRRHAAHAGPCHRSRHGCWCGCSVQLPIPHLGPRWPQLLHGLGLSRLPELAGDIFDFVETKTGKNRNDYRYLPKKCHKQED